MIPYVQDPDFTLYVGDACAVLAELPEASVDCCVTSPPYWGLRDYGTDGQLGLEATPQEYVAALVGVFAEVRRVLRPEGTLWLNLGDTYSRDPGKGGSEPNGKHDFIPDYGKAREIVRSKRIERGDGRWGGGNAAAPGLKEKDLVGIPWRVAFALQDAGWYLRSDIIWAKPNPMPESVTDRPTKAHEYVFLLAKQPRYFYDAAAIAEPATWYGPNGKNPSRGPHGEQMASRRGKNEASGNRRYVGFNESWDAAEANGTAPLTRNARSVWEIQTMQYADAHFAVFPEELPRRCIQAGCPEWVCDECGPVLEAEYNRDDATDDATRNHQVQGVRSPSGDHAPGQNPTVLLTDLCESRDSERAVDHEGLRDRPEGIQTSAPARAPDGEPRGLRHGTPPADGRASGSDANPGRSSASQERGQGRQPDREPGSHAQAPTRSESEAEAHPDPVSALRGTRASVTPHCSTCGGPIRPGITLDPFLGSGTTAKVARDLGRRCVGVELNPAYAALAARRLQQLSLLA